MTYISEKTASEALFELENPRQKSGCVRTLECQVWRRCCSTKSARFCRGGTSGQLHQTMPSGLQDSLSLFEVKRTGGSDNHGFASIQQIVQTCGGVWNPVRLRERSQLIRIRTEYSAKVCTPGLQPPHVNCCHCSVSDDANPHG